MDSTKITNHKKLALRITFLRSEKLRQEEELKYAFREFMYTLNPLSIVKSSIRQLSADKEIQFDLVKAGLNLGSNLIIDQVLGRGRSVKGFLSSVFIEKFSSSFINRNSSKIISGISRLFHSNKGEQKGH